MNDLVKVLIDTRQLVEATGAKRDYQQLFLFLNRSLHPDIRYMSIGHRLLLELSKSCYEAVRGRSNENADREITTVFMQQVGNAIDIPGMRTLTAGTADDVAGKDNKRAFSILHQIRCIAPEKPVGQIVSLEIVKGDEGFPGVYCIELTTATRVKYRMQLKGREPGSSFTNA
jgi:hypothetical protein